MTTRSHRALAALTAFVLAPALRAQAAPATIAPAARDSLLAVAGQLDAHWNAHESAGVAGVYTADGSLRLDGMAAPLEGRAAIARYFATVFSGVPAAMRHRTSIERLTPVADGVVLAEGTAVIDRDGAAGTARTFAVTSALVRTSEGWRIAWNRARLLPPA